MNVGTSATAWAWRAFWAVALGVGAWLAANACYRADDFGLVREAWAEGDLGAAIAHWWQFHMEPRDPGAWPKFYRPLWHATFLLDAHLFGANAAASAAWSWALHVGNAGLVAVLARRLLGAGAWPLLAAWLCLLPGAALQAPTWIAARGQVLAEERALVAIALATAPNLRTWPRAIGVAVAILIAAGAHDFGALAGPLAAWATWLQRRATATRTDWPTTIALPIAVAMAWFAWRASRLGTWIGGYESSAAGASEPFRLLDTLCTGTGALVLPGNGALPAGPVAWTGAFALLALAAASLVHHRGRTAARIATAMLVLSLAPAIGNTFRGDELGNGRYLYTAHCAWALGLPAILVTLHRGGTRRVAQGLAALGAGAAAIGFAIVAVGLQRTLDTTRAVFAAIDELPATPAVLLDLPDIDGAHPIGRNALPSALGAPFRTPLPHVLGWATDFDLQHGFVLGIATTFDRAPHAAAWHWNGRRGTFETRDAAPATVRMPPPTRPQLAPPGQPGDTTWTFQGQPGDGVVLLAGDEPGRFDLGAAGQLGVVQAQRLAVGVADAAGTLRFALPPAAANAHRLQVVALRGFGPSVFFTDVHLRADERRR